MISQYFMESLPFSSPDEFPKPCNLSGCFCGLNGNAALTGGRELRPAKVIGPAQVVLLELALTPDRLLE